MKELNINGIHVTDNEKEGIPLIFIHAFPLDSRMWNEQIRYFGEKMRIITYDVRGLGKSTSRDNQFTMESYANDFFDIINYLKLDIVNACGLSMGGYILLRALSIDNTRFKSIILADTRGAKDDDDGLLYRSNSIINIKKGKKEEFINTFLKKLLSEKGYKNTLIKNTVYNIIKEQTDEGICGAMLSLATRINTIELIKKVKVPVLILIGKDDNLTPIKYSKDMHKVLKNSHLKVIKNAGHLSNIENPEKFNKYLESFLKKINKP